MQVLHYRGEAGFSIGHTAGHSAALSHVSVDWPPNVAAKTRRSAAYHKRIVRNMSQQYIKRLYRFYSRSQAPNDSACRALMASLCATQLSLLGQQSVEDMQLDDTEWQISPPPMTAEQSLHRSVAEPHLDMPSPQEYVANFICSGRCRA